MLGMSRLISWSSPTALISKPYCQIARPEEPNFTRSAMPSRSHGAMTQEFSCMNKGETGKSWAGRLLIGGPPLLFLLVFFVGPSLIMILTSFRFPGEFGGLAPLAAPAGNLDSEHGFTPEAYQFFFNDLLYAEIFLKSFGVAAATTSICLIMAYPLAVLIARSEKRFRNLLV